MHATASEHQGQTREKNRFIVPLLCENVLPLYSFIRDSNRMIKAESRWMDPSNLSAINYKSLGPTYRLEMTADSYSELIYVWTPHSWPPPAPHILTFREALHFKRGFIKTLKSKIISVIYSLYIQIVGACFLFCCWFIGCMQEHEWACGNKLKQFTSKRHETVFRETVKDKFKEYVFS